MESFGLLQLLKALTPTPPPESEKREEPPPPPTPTREERKENAYLSFFEAHEARAKRTKK